MDLPPTVDPPGAAASGAESAQARRLAEGRAINREFCAVGAARVGWVGQLVADVRDEVRERMLALGDADLDVDAQELADRMCVDSVMGALGVGKYEATSLVNLSDRLVVLPEVRDAWSAGVLDAGRARVLANATEVLDDATARNVARELIASVGKGPWDSPAPRQWRTQVQDAVVRADPAAAEKRRAASVAARRVRSWPEGDGSAVLAVHAGDADIALADEVINDLARAWPAADPDGVRLSMDQRRADALIGLFRTVRNGSLADPPDCDRDAGSASGAGSAFGIDHSGDRADRNDAAVAPGPLAGVRLPRVPVRRVHDLGVVLHADTLFGDGPAAQETGQLRGLGQPDVLAPGSARDLARKQLAEGVGVQVIVVDDTGAVEHVVRLDRDTAEHCRSRQALVSAVRQKLADGLALQVAGHDPTEAIARHVRAAAPTCSFYDCPRQARSCDLDHDTPWPRGPTSVTNLDPKCRRHHNAKTLGVVRTSLNAGPGAGPRTVHWTLPSGIQVTTSPEPLPGTAIRPTPTPLAG